jgi:hypothetical protein
MKLNRNTYEIFLMDYLDGKLDAVEVSELLLFLEQHPDLKEEFEGIGGIGIDQDAVHGFDASLLKKPVYTEVRSRFEELLVARMEGDISAEEDQELGKAMLIYPELKKDESAFALTRLEPDLAMRFNRNPRVKVFVIRPYYRMLAGIAATLLLLAFGWVYLNNSGNSGNRMAAVPPGKGETGPDRHSASVREKTADSETDALIASAVIEAGKKPQTVKKAHRQQTEEISGAISENRPLLSALYIHPKIHAVPMQQQSAATVLPPVVRLQNKGQPAPAASEEEYVSLGTWLKNRFRKETDLENKEGILARINTATHADVVIEKDTTGKITRFEIAGIGLVNH